MSSPEAGPASAPHFTFAIETLGCKANLTDAHALTARLEAEGGTLAPAESADVYVLNSCTVTDRADRDALAALGKSRAKLRVFAGCLAEVDPAAISKVGGEGSVLLARNSAKPALAEEIARALRLPAGTREVATGDRSRWHREADFLAGAELKSGSRTRAFLKVQDGCNQFCSYCIIPHARGRSRSVSGDAVVREVADLANAGVKEVVLTAIHAADYENEGRDFTGLVERVLAETRIPRVRLTSLDPAEIDARLLGMMASESRLCAHFHVSLQSGSTNVLRGMRRGYDAARAEDCLNEIRAAVPHSFVGMDMIAGFPGETDEDHRDTMALLTRTPWTRLHVFPYSVRRSTEAARLVAAGAGVEEKVKRERAAEMRALSDARLKAELAKRVGKVVEVLTEANPLEIGGVRYSQGHTRSYFRVAVAGNLEPNHLVRVQIESRDESRDLLYGRLV